LLLIKFSFSMDWVASFMHIRRKRIGFGSLRGTFRTPQILFLFTPQSNGWSIHSIGH
jgi:hypothetical protein